MWLEMHLDKMFIDRAWLDYDGFETVADRQGYQERLAEELYFKHVRAIKKVMVDPEFYVIAESKMNSVNLIFTWSELISEHGTAAAKANAGELVKGIKDDSADSSDVPNKVAYVAKAKRAPLIRSLLAPVERVERVNGGYSNTQFNDITEEEIGK